MFIIFTNRNNFRKFFLNKINKFNKLKLFQFCQILDSEYKENFFDDEELRESTNLKNFVDFYNKNRKFISIELEKKLIFLEYYSEFIENIPKSKLNDLDFLNFNKIISKDLSEIDLQILKSNSLFVLSLIESLNKLDFFPGNSFEDSNSHNLSKLWIQIEYMILRTDFLKTLHFTNFDILLKTFQKFFMIKNTTISSEEIFESIEYEIIIQLKNFKQVFLPSQIERLSEIYTLYGKNLEGSAELYNIFIEKVFTKENIEQINKYSINLFTAVFFSSVLIQTYIMPSSNKKFQKFLSEMKEISEKAPNNKILKNYKEREILLNWCDMVFKNKSLKKRTWLL
jgi:hypothetical protein